MSKWFWSSVFVYKIISQNQSKCISGNLSRFWTCWNIIGNLTEFHYIQWNIYLILLTESHDSPSPSTIWNGISRICGRATHMRLFPLSSSWSHEQSGAQGLTQQKKSGSLHMLKVRSCSFMNVRGSHSHMLSIAQILSHSRALDT